MPTQQQQSADDRTSIADVDAITAAIQLYIDGVAQGDTAKLAEAFRPDAWMYGAIGDQRFDMPISAFFEHVAEHPADVDGRFAARITSIVHAGDAAGAIVAEENHMGTLTFVDFLTLCRSEGRWRIVNKTFAHTAGEMPQ
jgi:ketosteroid isomerase-like protein